MFLPIGIIGTFCQTYNIILYSVQLNLVLTFLIKSFVLNTFKTIQYFAKSKIIQSETRELASLKRDKIRPNEMDQWHNEQLYVPPLPPTNLRGCHLINIQYDIYVSTTVLRK